MRRTVLWACLVAASAVFAAPPARADQWDKTFQISGKASLRLDANDGYIEVNSSDAKEVRVRVITTGWRIGAGEVEITRQTQNGDHVEVELRVPRIRWSFSFSSIHREIRIEVTVPREANLDLHTGDGHITARNVGGEIRLDSGDGHITADGLRGNIRIHTADGHIEGSNLDGGLDADTGDGHMRVRGRFDLLHLRTGDGSITAEALAGSKITSEWNIRTGDGSVTLRLPDGFSAELDAHTGDGSISSQLPVTVSGPLNRTTLHGKMNSGGPSLTVRTGDGSIRIERI
jgi:DUF4097 and DUF4098 domain-containing protein YvlB